VVLKGLPILTKFLNPADYIYLEEDLREVDRFPMGQDQHTHRRWEYAMCLRAIREWTPTFHGNFFVQVADVGGAGSSLRDVLTSISIPVRIIDPKENDTLRKYRERCAQARFPIVACISTIEHVPAGDYVDFIEDLAALVLPRGLLFLTADSSRSSGVDKAHFNWMRERIYNPAAWATLANIFRSMGFEYFGGTDWTYYGNHVYDYSFCCVSLVKEPD
jgi:hypothetical protein